MSLLPATAVKSLQALHLELTSPRAEIVFKALGNSHRLRILKLLETSALTVNRLSELLELAPSTTNQHLNVLIEAGLVRSEIRPAVRGTEKVCRAAHSRVVCDLSSPTVLGERAVDVSMPIGAFVDFVVSRPCGLCSADKLIGFMGDADAFVEPERIGAQLLWFGAGYVEYRFPKRLPPRARLESLYLSAEICSEAPGYNMDWPSDITVWVNGVELGTWTSSSDFGDQRGLLNPDWWGPGNSQYGVLKSWQVNLKGSYIDGVQTSRAVVSDLNTDDRPYISVRIGVKDTARNQGGLNLFGHAFGNYPQDLVMRLIYDDS